MGRSLTSTRDSQRNGLPSWKDVCSGSFYKVPSFTDLTGPGILVTLANVGSQEPVAEVL